MDSDDIVNKDGLVGFHYGDHGTGNRPAVRINRRTGDVRVTCGRMRGYDGVFVRVSDSAGNMEYVQKGYGFGKFSLLSSESPLSPALTGPRQKLVIPVQHERVLDGLPVRKVEAVIEADEGGGKVVETLDV